MIYYILPFLVWLIFCIWRTLRTARRLRLIHYVFTLPLIVLSVLRGDVGTDTATYIGSAQYIIWWGPQRPVDLEPGYVILVRLLACFTGDPRIVVNIISLLAAILFFVMLYVWEDGHCLVSLMLIPVFYFDFTMNGLRMGLAFPLAVIAILFLERKRFALFYILAIVAISIQMTVVLLLPMLILATRGVKLSLRGALYTILIGLTMFYPTFYFFKTRIIEKMAAYALFSSPTSLSGLGPLILSCFAALFAIWISEKRHRYLGLAFLLIQVAFYGVTTFTYAGIRFQQMALFAQLLSLSYWAIRPITKKQLAIIVLFCCVAMGWKTRNFIVTSGEPSAFLPYHFMWEGS
jgi:hypothetical protein